MWTRVNTDVPMKWGEGKLHKEIYWKGTDQFR